MKNTGFFLLIFMAVGQLLYGQSYFVYFTDKGENVEMLSDPFSFLSPKAVQKKALRKVSIDQTDLPVDRAYLNALRERGFEVKMKSRWFNFAVVEAEEASATLESLPFVKKVEKARQYEVQFAGEEKEAEVSRLTYGKASRQVSMLNGDYLHDNAFLGEGMTIAVLDGGFSGAPSLNGLDSLWLNGQILGHYDFVQNDTDVFDVGSHGTKVLSIMGGFIPDKFAGSAIKANYWLLKSENEISETVSEMYNWLAAAEFADSVGADIITSSLGYNNFDGGVGDYDYQDMDGNTTVVTQAADMAASKGMLVIVSAGNEGNSSWGKITAPADADSVLAVGAVGADGIRASFSSTGPTADGRIKPDVMAMGASTAFLNFSGPVTGNGTSFACPVITGLAACLWQSDTSRTSMEIFQAIRSTASQIYTPDNSMGYGIANFRDAAWTIGQKELEEKELDIKVYPNPVGPEYWLKVNGLTHGRTVSVTTYDLTGQVLIQQDFFVENNVPVSLNAPESAGAFVLAINTGDKVHLEKITR